MSEPIPINGQWVGLFSDFPGHLILDIDDMVTHYEGRAYIYDQRPEIPSTFAFFKTKDTASSFHLDSVPLMPIDPTSNLPSSWTALKELYPFALFPQIANIRIDADNLNLKVSWETDIGTKGSGLLPRSKAGTKSELIAVPNVGTWERFKEFVAAQEFRQFIFRGQAKPYRLRTGYHRTGRADLTRFQNEDINALNRHLSGLVRHKFDLSNPDEYGAFFSLAQHHGYPTPMLDWTYSAYVAAFFAYHRITNAEALNASSEDKVRIFVFDKIGWCQTFSQYRTLSAATPHFSLMEFLALENLRAVPQQSISSVTNIDDIELHIRNHEIKAGANYLRVIDLPKTERRKVMRDLSTMGVTAGSLFPGLDGACEELRERNFNI